MTTKQKIGRFFKSLVNNTVALEEGRRSKWWSSLILFLLSIIIAVIPTMIVTGKVKGQDVFRGSLYSTEVYLQKFHENLSDNDVDLIITNEKPNSYISHSENFELTFNNELTLKDDIETEVAFKYYSFSKEIDGKETEVFRVYYTGNIDKVMMKKNKILSPQSFLSSYLFDATPEITNISSHLIIGKNDLLLRIYNPAKATKGSTPVKNLSGVYTNINDGTNLKDFYTKDKDGNAISASDVNFSEQFMDNWKQFANNLYKPIKTKVFFSQSGISLLIYAVLSAFIGLVIFLITRGKNNPNRDIRFGESMKIGCWLLLTPALITLLIGSFAPQMAALIYIGSLGMRTVWLSMRTLNPHYQEPPKK